MNPEQGLPLILQTAEIEKCCARLRVDQKIQIAIFLIRTVDY